MKVHKLVVHHSASNKATTKKSDIAKWHKERGFSQIGYHKIIEGNGTIVNGRSENIQGAHAKGVNQGSLGVCVVGDFEKETPVRIYMGISMFLVAVRLPAAPARISSHSLRSLNRKLVKN